jgi:hypothetical protein
MLPPSTAIDRFFLTWCHIAHFSVVFADMKQHISVHMCTNKKLKKLASLVLKGEKGVVLQERYEDAKNKIARPHAKRHATKAYESAHGSRIRQRGQTIYSVSREASSS